jgi:predicted TIM-barrel fold metal-dependent hydrolase
MPYASGRVIHDADAHIMEVPGFLTDHLEAKYRATITDQVLFPADRGRGLHKLMDRNAGKDGDAVDETQIMLRKNWDALGSYTKADRPRSIDLLGFASQLMFTTQLLNFSALLEGKGEVDVIYAVARAHTRHMVGFCSVDKRLLPTGYVPLADFELTKKTAREAIDAGAKALMIPSRCPDGHSPSHIGLDPLWAMAQEAGIPIVLHVGGGGVLLEKQYFNNGLPPVPDFHGGDDNFKSIDYMAIAYPPMKAMTALIVDRVLDRFPDLKFGVIEQGASWVPGWMRNMDSAHNAFYKNEERLQKMSLKPSEYVKRQVRVTPYPHEDAGWIIANSGDEVCLFSSDYPHVEGGRNPIKRFEASMAAAGIGEAQKQRFYCDNFIDLMGAGLAPELRHPKLPAAA